MKTLDRIVGTLVLPSQISEFEARYLRRMNRVALGFFALHVPVFAVVAFFNDTNPLLALLLTSLVVAGPVIANVAFSNPRMVSVVYGFTAMLMGGLIVHFGQGPMQIEMHFYFFATIAMLALFGNPMVIVTAAATVAVHHLVLWLVVPASVFNYDAQGWVVVVHALFVVLESVGTVFIARSFFDNVIGLEKNVLARTGELDARNREMRLVLDNVDQALVMLDRAGAVQAERSAVVETWFPGCRTNTLFVDHVRKLDARFADTFELGWFQLVEGYLPIELCIAQMPPRLTTNERSYRVKYTPIRAGEQLARLMVVISDVTGEHERERLEAEQREVMSVFDRIVSDRAGFVEYFEEAEETLDHVLTSTDLTSVKRGVHTLKGNSALFGVHSVAEICHDIETRIDDELRAPEQCELDRLVATWGRLKARLGVVFDQGNLHRIEIEPLAFDRLLAAALREGSGSQLAQMIADLKMEPTVVRLNRIADQARRIAARLGKGDITIAVDDHTLRLDPQRWQTFWAAFVHVVRNAVDHGLEYPEERTRMGKDANGSLSLETAIEEHELVIRLCDDGRGIAWDRVRDKAERLGLSVGSQRELEEVLFADGFSTSSEVTEYSGRGVGLAAVREACEARGGTVRITSAAGGGTTFEFRFPTCEMAPTPTELLGDHFTKAA